MDMKLKYLEQQLKELKHIEQKYKILLDTVPVIELSMSKESNYEHLNTLLETYKGKEIEEIKDTITKLVYTDYQTGLLNRSALNDYMKYKFEGKIIQSILINIKSFKYINDTYGSLVGDEILKLISEQLKIICKNDLIFRFGGNEFIIISNYDEKATSIEEKAETILSSLKEIQYENVKPGYINASIGISMCKCDGKNCNNKKCKLISKAETALLEAKKYSENNYVVYNDDLEDKRIKKYNIERALKQAVKNDEIVLVYQPQYAKGNKVYGFEALFRWNSNIYSNIPIIDIIKIMEESDLIITIGKEIIKKACIFAKQINKNSKEKIIVSFNVSPIQIMKNDFVDVIKSIIEETKVNPKWIGIEITETVLMNNIEENLEKIKKLKELGIKIALDDFGVGYSSLNYLVKLPISTVKIDRSFIIDMEKSKEYKTLVKLIIDVSNSLKLSTVAEGVDSEEQKEILESMGIDYIQGYLLSKPLVENEALKLI